MNSDVFFKICPSPSIVVGSCLIRYFSFVFVGLTLLTSVRHLNRIIYWLKRQFEPIKRKRFKAGKIFQPFRGCTQVEFCGPASCAMKSLPSLLSTRAGRAGTNSTNWVLLSKKLISELSWSLALGTQTTDWTTSRRQEPKPEEILSASWNSQVKTEVP